MATSIIAFRYCACGCNQQIPPSSPNNPNRRYVHGHNSIKQSIETTCHLCKKPITVARYLFAKNKNHFCSTICAGINRRSKIEKVCRRCQATFAVIPARQHKAIYCSKPCQRAYESITRKCEQCGDSVTRPRSVMIHARVYCSTHCQHVYQSAHCRGKAHPKYRGGSRSHAYGVGWAVAKQSALHRANDKCEQCGKRARRLEVHHKVPVRCFKDVSHAHFESNLITLCCPCHGAAHAEIRKTLLDFIAE